MYFKKTKLVQHDSRKIFILFQITQSLNFWVRKACEIETNGISIERICEYTKIDKEVSFSNKQVMDYFKYQCFKNGIHFVLFLTLKTLKKPLFLTLCGSLFVFLRKGLRTRRHKTSSGSGQLQAELFLCMASWDKKGLDPHWAEWGSKSLHNISIKSV